MQCIALRSMQVWFLRGSVASVTGLHNQYFELVRSASEKWGALLCLLCLLVSNLHGVWHRPPQYDEHLLAFFAMRQKHIAACRQCGETFVLVWIAVQIVVRRRRRRCWRAVFCCAVVCCAVCRQCKQTQSIYFCFQLNFDESSHGTIFPHLSCWAKSACVLQGWGWRARGQGEGGREGGSGRKAGRKGSGGGGSGKGRLFRSLHILRNSILKTQYSKCALLQLAGGPWATCLLFYVKCTLMDPGPLGQLEFLKAIRFGRCILGTLSFCTCLEYLHMCMYIYIYVHVNLQTNIYIYIYTILEFNMLAFVLCCNWLVAHGPPAVFCFC